MDEWSTRDQLGAIRAGLCQAFGMVVRYAEPVWPASTDPAWSRS